MAQDLLKLCQHAADRALIRRPASIINNTADVARVMLASAQDEGEVLCRRPENGWVDMVRELTFNIALSGICDATTANKLDHSAATFQTNTVSIGDNVTNTTDDTTTTVSAIDSETVLSLNDDIFTTGEAYTIYRQGHALPSDYKFLIDDTLWDRNFYWELRGPLNPQKWQTYKSSVLGDTATTRRRWRIHNLDAAGKRFRLDPAPEDDAVLVLEYMSNGWCTNLAGTAQTEWLLDTDLPVLDQYLFRLGITWRVLERLGLDYVEARDEYEDQVDNVIGRDTGGDTLLLTSPRPFSLLTTCNVPDTGFGT